LYLHDAGTHTADGLVNNIGSILGAVLGVMLGGRFGWLTGALFGAIGWMLGAQFDRGRASVGNTASRLAGAERQALFFSTTFRIMGHLAKADGRVSEEEIQAARELMHRMRLPPEAVRQAIAEFTAGKQSGFSLDQQLEDFRRGCGGDPTLVRALLEFQMDMVLSKGGIQVAERKLLWQIAGALGVSQVELAQMEAVLRAQRRFGGTGPSRGEAELGEAYRALGVEPDASDKEVKTAYRRLMNQHHPDKLVSRGLPDSMLESAKERTREIRAAYELIRERRGIR
jgi:DnaJ like chaperone protein